MALGHLVRHGARAADKKVDAALVRLRDTRERLGRLGESEHPDAVNHKLKQAALAGDISTVISLITQASVRSPGEFIRDSLGSLMFMVYLFEDTFKHEARDMEDLVDGLLYLDAKNYTREAEMRASQQQTQATTGKGGIR